MVGVTVEEWGHRIEWGDREIGIDTDTLYRIGKEQTGLAYPVTEFNSWMERNGLSLSAAAKTMVDDDGEPEIQMIVLYAW